MQVQLNLTSESASATKTQIANGKILFGSKAPVIIKSLVELSKQKLLQTDDLDRLLEFLKSAAPDQIEKIAKAKSGSTMAKNFTALSKIKTVTALFKAVKAAKITKSVKDAVPSTDKVSQEKPQTGLRDRYNGLARGHLKASEPTAKSKFVVVTRSRNGTGKTQGNKTFTATLKKAMLVRGVKTGDKIHKLKTQGKPAKGEALKVWTNVDPETGVSFKSSSWYDVV